MWSWSNLSAGQKEFYLEFHAPIVNNIRQEPDNNDIILSVCFTPSQLHINSVIDTEDSLVRTLNYSLTEGQQNAVLLYIQEMTVVGSPRTVVGSPRTVVGSPRQEMDEN